MSSRFWPAFWVLATVPPLCACGAEPQETTRGEVVWSEVGGLCDGPCRHATTYRNGDMLTLTSDVEDGAQNTIGGHLTRAGQEEYERASEATGVTDEDDACAAVDGIDIVIILDGTARRTVSYCASREVPAAVQRIDAFFDEVIDALLSCESNRYVEPSC